MKRKNFVGRFLNFCCRGGSLFNSQTHMNVVNNSSLVAHHPTHDHETPTLPGSQKVTRKRDPNTRSYPSQHTPHATKPRVGAKIRYTLYRKGVRRNKLGFA